MANAETARLIASLELQDKFSGTANKALGTMGKLDAAVGRSGGRAYKAGTQIGTGIKNGALIAAGAIGFLATQVGFGLKSLSELDDVVTQSNAVLKSTKGVAGESAEAIRNLAEKYESLNATIDDKVIQSGENLLLTFTNIRKEAFEPALLAALNMNKALGGGEEGLQGTIQKLGKALNDPIKGLTALGRVGITFTKQQKEQITAAVKAGDTFKAQGIILAELDKRFGGSFLAGGATTTGKVAKFKDAIDDLQKTLATALLPVIGKVADGLSKFLDDPAVIRGAKDLGDAIAGLFSDKNLAQGADFLKGAFETAKSAAPVVADAARATFGLVQAAVGLFKSLPPELQKLAVGAFAVNKLTGGLVTNIAGGIIDTVGKQFLQRGGTPANPLFVADVTGGKAGLAGGVAGAGQSVGSKIASAATKVFMVGAAIGVFAELKGILDEQSGRNKAQEAGLAAQTSVFTGGATLADLKTALAGVDAQIADLGRSDNLSLQGLAFGANIDGVRDAVFKTRADLVAAITAQGGQTGVAGRLSDALKIGLATALGKPGASGSTDRNMDGAGFRRVVDASTDAAEKIKGAVYGAGGLQSDKVTHAVSALGQKFGSDIRSLRAATKPFDVAKFARAIASDVQKGSGSVKGTTGVLKDLRIKLAETHDPKLQAVLRAAIHTVSAKLPNRQWVDKELALGKKIAGNGETASKKIADLKTIETALKRAGDTHAASTIHKLEANITATNKVKTATDANATAIKNKNLSVELHTTNNVVVTNGAIRRATTTYSELWGSQNPNARP